MTKKHSATLIAAVSMTLLTASAAHAIDGWSGDYTPLPAGSSAGLMYFQYNNSGTYRADGSDVANSSLDYSAITARFVHYFELGGKPAALQAYVPIVDYFDPEIGGANLATADGWGDLTLGASYWVMSAAPDDATGTTLAGSLFLTLPTGDYEYGSVSSGSGTTTITPQIGLQQGLGNGLFMDVIYDVAFAVDHNEGGLEISTDPAHQLQGYLRYQQSARTSFSIGYSGLRGGQQQVDGSDVGAKIDKDTLRLGAKTMLTDTLQVAGRVDYDFNLDDGFKSEPLVNLRFLKVF